MVQLTAEALRSIHWFNPLVWLACRRLRIESEHACDDAVLARGFEGPEYAAHLLTLARTLNAGRRVWLPAPAMARPSSLEGRITAMLNAGVNRRPVSRSSRFIVLATLLALTAIVGGLRAQTTFYSLVGVLQDQTNRVLPGAKVVLTNTTSEAKYEVKTDATGRYEFVGLPSASYTLEAALAGFATFKDTVRVAGNLQRNIAMQVGSLQETISVTGGGPRAEPPSSASSSQRAEEGRRRFQELEARAKEKCAAGAGPIGGNIFAPRKVVDKRPVYPEQLQAAKIGGTVTMEAIIGIDGMVRDVTDVKGPHPDLEVAAADAVRQWQFSTTLLNCEAIEVKMRVTTNFVTQ
jgi:TonB family protein